MIRDRFIKRGNVKSDCLLKKYLKISFKLSLVMTLFPSFNYRTSQMS